RMRPTLPSAAIFSPSADLKRSETRRSNAPKCPERRDGTSRSVVGVGSGIADRHNPTGVESADELTLPGGALCGSGDSHRVIGAITAHATARIGGGPRSSSLAAFGAASSIREAHRKPFIGRTAHVADRSTILLNEDGCGAEAKLVRSPS